MANIREWSAHSERLCFHLLAGGEALRDLFSRPLIEWLMLANWQPSHIHQLSIVNMSNGAFDSRLGDLGLRYYRSSLFAATRYKVSQYTVIKLFMHRLLSLDRVLVLDSDVLVMADMCELWDWFTQQLTARPAVVAAYAFEQQNEYRFLDVAMGPYRRLPNKTPSHAQGYNGGVGLLALNRMRSQPSFERALDGVLRFAEVVKLERCHRAFASMHTCVHIECGLISLGDQTILTLAARLEPRWDELVAPIPCDWNWQMSLAYYTPSYQSLAPASCRDRLNLLIKVDSMCPTPPRLLHLNHPAKLKSQLQRTLKMLGRDAEQLSHNRAALSSLLKRTYAARMCRNADYWLNLSHRACNATFLLTRLREYASSQAEREREAIFGAGAHLD